MHKILKFGVLAAIAAFQPVSANSGQSAEWWLVIDDGNAQVARFVDMGSMNRSGDGAQISIMTLSRSGHREMQILTVDCERVLGSQGDASVKEFVCGTEEYRNSSGLILGPVSPDEMAAIVFAGQSGQAAGDIRGTA